MIEDIQELRDEDRRIHGRLQEGTEEMKGIREDLVALDVKLLHLNDTMLAYMAQNAELLDIYKGIKATIRIFGLVERFCVFLVKIGTAGITLWAFFKYVILQAIQQGSKGP